MNEDQKHQPSTHGHRHTHKKSPQVHLMVGSIVWYRLENGRNQGEIRPAIIIRINEPDTDHPKQTLNLNVFMDGQNDPHSVPQWARFVTEGDGIGQWQWPS